jgi:hypothetical protein
MTHYKEIQKFRQPWLLALLGLALGLPLLLIGFGPGADGSPEMRTLFSSAVALYALVSAVILAWFLAINLETRLEDDSVSLKFHLLWPKKTYALSEIAEAEVRTYRPIVEYGGWGVRFGRRGRAFNVSGNRGVELTLTNGKRVMLGSRQPEELYQALVGRIGTAR